MAVAVKEGLSPILRWAGGKRWLLHQLQGILGSFEIVNYHEPFLGGASMFLGLAPSGDVYLSDLNAELIETYEQVRDHSGAVANALDRHVNSLDHYYNVREQSPATAVERAARFIYLNHTSFNGIYRVNLEGRYNVPFGNRKSPNIPTRSDLRAVAKRLEGVTLSAGDFADGVERVRKGDLVFLDPPYTVAHNFNGFIKYNQKLFSFDDQRRLREMIDRVRAKGAYFILTNAAHESIVELFGHPTDRRFEVLRRNAIGGKKAERGTAMEFLFTNVPES